MKNIVLIEPRSPDFHVFSRYHLPRLGVLILGAILEQAGHYVKVFVEDMTEIDFRAVFEADLVGISTITSTAPRAYEMAASIKGHGIPVVLGGPHVTYMAEEALGYSDYVIRGEAENAILPFIQALEQKTGLGEVPGLSFRVGNEFYHNPAAERCPDLDTLPFPDFSMIREPLGSIRPVLTSRGCPHDCTFCVVTKMFGRGYRFRSKENVLRELRTVDPKQTIFFYDDNFTANRTRTKELLQMMIAEDITPRWTAQTRVDVVRDRELMELMKRSNCHYVYVGIESVNQASLDAYNKKITVAQIEEAIAKFHEYGIRVHGMFVMGCDEDSIETLRETARFAKRNQIDTIQFIILTPMPGTSQYYDFMKDNRLLTRDWGLYDGHHVVFQPKQMSPFELQVEAMKAMRSFYSIPEIIKSISKLDLLGVFMKSYSRGIYQSWMNRNRYYYGVVKNMTADTADRMNLTWNQTREEISTRVQEFLDRNAASLKKLKLKGESTPNKGK